MLSRSRMCMQLSTYFTYICKRNDDILRICAHECISETIVAFAQKFRIDFVQILITVATTITFYASWYIFPSISISIGKTWRNNINKFHEKKKLSLRRYNYQVMNLINEGLKGFVQKWDSYIDTFAIFRLWKPKRRINR